MSLDHFVLKRTCWRTHSCICKSFDRRLPALVLLHSHWDSKKTRISRQAVWMDRNILGICFFRKGLTGLTHISCNTLLVPVASSSSSAALFIYYLSLLLKGAKLFLFTPGALVVVQLVLFFCCLSLSSSRTVFVAMWTSAYLFATRREASWLAWCALTALATGHPLLTSSWRSKKKQKRKKIFKSVLTLGCGFECVRRQLLSNKLVCFKCVTQKRRISSSFQQVKKQIVWSH